MIVSVTEDEWKSSPAALGKSKWKFKFSNILDILVLCICHLPVSSARKGVITKPVTLSLCVLSILHWRCAELKFYLLFYKLWIQLISTDFLDICELIYNKNKFWNTFFIVSLRTHTHNIFEKKFTSDVHHK